MALIKQDWERLHELSECRNYTASKFYEREEGDTGSDANGSKRHAER